MKEVTVVSYDDLHLAEEDRRVPADGTVTLAYNGTAVEIDLTDKNRDELEAGIMPYLKVGRRVAGRTGPRPGTTYPPGTRAAKQAMRNWADEQVRLHPELAEAYNYISPGSRAPGKRPIYYYKDRLKRDYAAHLAQQAPGGPGPLPVH